MKLKKQNGYILSMTLLVLVCTMLWSNILLLSLSDQYAASNDMVRREQSRLLAQSGWNLALQQLETAGSTADISVENAAGTLQVQMDVTESNLIQIQAQAEAGGYPDCVEGSVRLLRVPWREISQWPTVDSLESLQEASFFCSETQAIALSQSLQQSLAIGSLTNQPMQVTVTEPISCAILYVDGDLTVEAPLEAEAIYTSGQINGLDQIACAQVFQQYTTEPDYRLQVINRVL